MLIRPEAYDSLLEQLHGERFNNGNEYVCFEVKQPVFDKWDLHFAASDHEALEYCHEMTTDLDRFTFLSIRSTIRAMQEAKGDENLMIMKEGWVDVAEMTNQRIKRLTTSNTFINHKNFTTMNEKNYEFLKNQIKLTGFGESHGDNLKAHLEKQQPDFVLTHKANFGKDEVVATLHFRKSQESDMYFFNKYNILMQKQGEENVVKQMIYLRNKEDNISFKEAYNLLNDRSVFKEKTTKEGEKYLTWVKLDFKETDKEGSFKMKSQSFGYDISKALEKYPIVEISDPDVKKSIINSIERGNRQEVTFEVEGKQNKMYIEANPASGVNHALKVYDAAMQRVQGLSKGEEQSNGQAKKEEQKSKVKAGEEDESDRPTQSRRRSRGIA
ncbi:MAG: hypothetical protein J0I84_17990 [Terrimonas sp.]|nr:hypothetical protein [Terrimonas sp.]